MRNSIFCLKTCCVLFYFLNKDICYGGRFFVRVYTNLNAIVSPIHTGNVMEERGERENSLVPSTP